MFYFRKNVPSTKLWSFWVVPRTSIFLHYLIKKARIGKLNAEPADQKAISTIDNLRWGMNSGYVEWKNTKKKKKLSRRRRRLENCLGAPHLLAINFIFCMLEFCFIWLQSYVYSVMSSSIAASREIIRHRSTSAKWIIGHHHAICERRATFQLWNSVFLSQHFSISQISA
jgi:hypothetical protein